MRKPRLSHHASALLPWVGAALVWFGVVVPMRAEEGSRLSEQSRLRRDRLKSELSLRQTQSRQARVAAAINKACRASPDPSALRQSVVSASLGLGLSPFTLSVTGGLEGGAAVEAVGSRDALLRLLRRLGDPSRGGFLRSVTLRDKGRHSSLTATTGVFGSFPQGVLTAPPACPGSPDPELPEPRPLASKAPRPSLAPLQTPRPPAGGEASEGPSPSVGSMPELPFALVGFFRSNGKNQASIRVGDQVRMVSVGDVVDGWKCLSIDRDEGVVFSSTEKGRLALRPLP